MGRPYSRKHQFTEFGEYLVALADSKKIKVASLESVVGNKFRLYKALRGSTKTRSAPLLSYAELSRMAEKLDANRQETRRLILLGLLQHVPDELRSCLVRAVTQSIAQAKRLGSRPPELDFSGKDLKLPDELP